MLGNELLYSDSAMFLSTQMFKSLAQAAPDTAAQSIANTGATISMLVFIGIGLVLLLFGRKFAKVALSLVGLFYGVVITVTLAEIFPIPDQWLFLVVIAGGLIGLGLTRVIFRFWTTVGTGLLVGYLAPALMLAAVDARLLSLPQDAEPSEGASPFVVAAEEAKKQVDATTGGLDALEARETIEDVTQSLDGIEKEGGLGSVFSDLLKRNGDEAPETETAGDAEAEPDDGTGVANSEIFEQTAEAGNAAMNWLKTSGGSLRHMYATETMHLHSWWAEKGAGYRQQLLIGAFVGFGIGIGLGMFMPDTATSLQTSVIGALLLTIPGRTLLDQLFAGNQGEPGQLAWLPHTPRMVLLTVCLITAMGVYFQCRGKTKKSDD